MAAEPRVAIVGAGLMGYWHAVSAHRLGAPVRAVIDPDRDRAAALAGRFRGCEVVADLRALPPLGVAAVHVCSPLPTHAGLVREAVDAGLHALVEKPLAQGADETRTLFDRAREASVVLCPVHQMAFQRGVARARLMLPGLGRVAVIQMQVASAGGAAGGDLQAIVADILPHVLSLLQALWPAAALEAGRWSITRPREGEMLIAGAHAGALLSVAISMRARPTCFEMIVRGEAGSVMLDLFHGFAVAQPGRVSRLDKVARPFSAGVRGLAAAFNLGVRGVRREAAYPGLRPLVERFYQAARGLGPSPIGAEAAVAVAVARDQVMAAS